METKSLFPHLPASIPFRLFPLVSGVKLKHFYILSKFLYGNAFLFSYLSPQVFISSASLVHQLLSKCCFVFRVWSFLKSPTTNHIYIINVPSGFVLTCICFRFTLKQIIFSASDICHFPFQYITPFRSPAWRMSFGEFCYLSLLVKERTNIYLLNLALLETRL